MLDFSCLSDDQLIQFTRCIWAELIKRGKATTSAGKSVIIEESEKYRIIHNATELELDRIRKQEESRIAQQAAEDIKRQAEKQKKGEEQRKIHELWQAKDKIALIFQHLLRIKHTSTLKVWQSSNGLDTRIYINSDRKKSHRFSFEELCYY
jgi:hypothetical protein